MSGPSSLYIWPKAFRVRRLFAALVSLKLDISDCILCNYANFCKFFLKFKAVNNHRTQTELRSLDKAFLS